MIIIYKLNPSNMPGEYRITEAAHKGVLLLVDSDSNEYIFTPLGEPQLIPLSPSGNEPYKFSVKVSRELIDALLEGQDEYLNEEKLRLFAFLLTFICNVPMLEEGSECEDDNCAGMAQETLSSIRIEFLAATLRIEFLALAATFGLTKSLEEMVQIFNTTRESLSGSLNK